VSALFVLDRKFDPTKHIYEFQAMEGNLAYVQDAMQRFDQDTSRMLGMTNPADTLNPEVMKDGNSGYKLQLAMGPNQLIQDEMVKNCATGLKDLIYIVWKTMIQYADDYNMQQLAEAMLPNSGGFLDAKSMENFDFIDRNMINIDLALGFLSDENRLTRQQLITQAQAQFAGLVAQLDPSVPELFQKARRPFEDTLYALGVKNCDAYLPTLEEAAKVAQSKAKQGPSTAEQEMQSKVGLNQAKTKESQTVSALNIKKAEDIDTDNMFEMMAAKRGKLSAVEID
jgi:thiol-disulfide isomerase/thioredoxin